MLQISWVGGTNHYLLDMLKLIAKEREAILMVEAGFDFQKKSWIAINGFKAAKQISYQSDTSEKDSNRKSAPRK